MSTSFPRAFSGTVTWYTEADEEKRVTSPTFGSINDAQDWCEEYITEHDLDGLGEIRVIGVEHVAPGDVQKRSAGNGEGKKRPVRKTKLSRAMSKTLVEALMDAQQSGDTKQIRVKPHDGMIAKGLATRGLISRVEDSYWRMTPEGRRMAEYLLSVVD